MQKTIIDHLNEVKNIIESKTVYSFRFNLSDLPEHNSFELDIRSQLKFKQLFKDLDEKKTNCLYWFECINNKKAESLISALNSKREGLLGGNNGLWKIPPHNSNTDSKVIYVGVRQGGVRKKDNLSNLSGRICQHLGYYKNGSTGALHLLQWAFGLDYEITLNVMEIGTLEQKQYLYIIEKIASIALKPLCGKH